MSPLFWTAYWAFTAFVFGAIVGSFLNVCIWRLPRGESVANAPSHCPACNTRLRFFPDMVPLLSVLWFRARCRYCGERFGWRYFWVELTCALTFLAIYLRYVPFSDLALSEETRNLLSMLAMGFTAALILVFFIDLEHFQIPDVAILAAVIFALAKDALLIFHQARPLWQNIPGTPWSIPLPLSVLGGLVAFWLLWQFAALSSAALAREAMGAGDSLLLAAMGAFLIPWPLLVLAFMIAVLLGTIGGLTGMWIAGRQASAPTSDACFVPEVEPGAEHAEGDPSSAEPVGLRGMMEVKPPEEESVELEAPELPPASRWGRLLTVFGSWMALGAVWGGAVFAARNPAFGIIVGIVFGAIAVTALWFGIRVWVRGDREWLPAMDELFEEGDPGPRFIPFGPYLVAGTLIAMLIGRPLIEMYWKSMALTPLVLPWD